MIIEEEVWKGIPVLHFFDEKMNEHSPVLIFLHGFESAKEHNLHYAYQLVKKGIRVILPDAYLHGAREEKLNKLQMNMKFWEIVIQSIHEVECIYEELLERFVPKKIGIAGTSMGAITTFGCLKRYAWIDAAAICMGAPGYNDFAAYQLEQFEKSGVKLPLTEEQKEQLHNILAEYDITNVPEQLRLRPLIFWHGDQDCVVPFENAYHFYTVIRPYYEQCPERLQFIVAKNQAHKLNREGVLAVTEFLFQQLMAK